MCPTSEAGDPADARPSPRMARDNGSHSGLLTKLDRSWKSDLRNRGLRNEEAEILSSCRCAVDFVCRGEPVIRRLLQRLLGDCGRQCGEAFVDSKDKEACIWGCRGGCGYGCDNATTIK